MATQISGLTSSVSFLSLNNFHRHLTVSQYAFLPRSTSFVLKGRFAHEGCGGVGPFPSFRHFDCETENGDKEAWHFYETYAAGCLKEDGSNPSSKPGNKGDKPVKPKTNPDPRPAPMDGS